MPTKTMQLKALLADDDAVSPVIGVILMVAITVILAAVIGSFVLGLGDQVSEAQPSPTVDFNYTNTSGGGNFQSFGIQHNGGDSLDPSTINVSVGGTVVWAEGSHASGQVGQSSGWNVSEVTATDQMWYFEHGNAVFSTGDDVSLVWSADSGDTAVLAEGTV